MSNLIKGQGASQGIATGQAKIILKEKDFAKFKNGDILIAKQTSPAWTPLFGAAAGIVTEFGGILCHAAIVAREYGIPAVVGTKDATKLIKDGDLIKVNGSDGSVELP